MPEPVESYRPYRLEVAGTLRMETFHIGSGNGFSLVSDSPILRDTKGRPYVPGSSLRGVLRAYLEREASADEIRILFGETPARDSDRPSQLGRLTVADAFPVDGGAAYTEVRDHVALDTRHGAAAKGAKFDQEVSADPLSLGFALTYEGDSESDPALALVEDALRALRAGEIACGAKSGCGYGRIRLKETAFRAFDRSKPEGLVAWLGYRLKPDSVAPAREFPGPRRQAAGTTAYARLSRLALRLRLQFDGPVLVRAPLPPLPSGREFDANVRESDGEKGLETADHVFVQTGGGDRYYLPGSSLRGVLRHQAAKICGTLGAADVLDKLFGTVKSGAGRRGLVEVEDGRLDGDPKPVYLDHVALDRITGFAADARKFSTCGLASPVFEMAMRIRFTGDDLAAVALAGFVLRDMLEGWLWCGGGVTRGFGHLHSAAIVGASVDLTEEFSSRFPPPPGFLASAQRETRPGHLCLAVEGPAFADFAWLWSLAQEAWNTSLPPKGNAA
jgi:CRISPR/Cas system CSM-associated protein Csm3 (group 7 of RAMP superfamily)